MGFFDQIMSVDTFVIYDDVQYERRGWRNRNRLKGPDGSVWVTVPVEQKGRFHQLVNEVKIDNTRQWRRKHLGTIEALYKKAPYFDNLFPELEQILNREWEYLWELDVAVIGMMNEIFDIGTQLVLSSRLEVEGGKSDRLLNICVKLGADEYYSGAAARQYLDLELFRSAGIEVFFQEYEHPVYPQLHGKFLSHLSALDLVMIAAPESGRIIRSGTKWVKGT